MKPFMFVFTGKPSPEKTELAHIKDAIIHVWVIDESLESARRRAVSYVTGLQWSVESTEFESEMLPSQLQGLHKDEALLYRRALRLGMAADFVASPKVDGDPDDPIWIAPMG